MDVAELSVPGAWVFTPKQHPDERGTFLEWYRADTFTKAVGHALDVAQANHSISRGGAIRGLHFALVPPGQAKYVYCPRGALLDVVVDIRVGSPTFGRWEAVELNDVDRRAVYVAEGLGHGWVPLGDEAELAYLCSTQYTPSREFGIHPLDTELAIDWQITDPVLSPRDAAAPTLAEARETGLLPDYEACTTWYADLSR